MKSLSLLTLMLAAGLAGTSLAVAQDGPNKVLLLVNGTLGDKSFFDSANHGMELIKEKYGDAVETRTLEMGFDQSKWESTLMDVAGQDYDLVITGTYQMTDAVIAASDQYPDTKFVVYDATMPYDQAPYANVYSIGYKQNEASYLGGMLVAGLLRDGTIPASDGASIGFLGGMDIPVINDFLVGYIAGAQAVTPDIKVAISYVGNFSDAAKGKELALAQYSSGTAIGFNVAAGAGLGQLAAAKDANKHVLGVDADQAAVFAESDPAISALIVSSVLKNVDASLARAYDMFVDGTLPFGTAENLGLKENSVGLVETGYMADHASAELKQQIANATKAIIDGSIVVPTGLGMDTAELNSIRDAVRP
jgi:basic membrane protein A